MQHASAIAIKGALFLYWDKSHDDMIYLPLVERSETLLNNKEVPVETRFSLYMPRRASVMPMAV